MSKLSKTIGEEERTLQAIEEFLATMLASQSRVSVEDAERIAAEHFNKRSRAVALTGERDENFQIISDDGARYVLKIAHPADRLDLIDLSTAAMLHVEQAAPTLSCPRVVADKAGAHIVKVRDSAGVERWARLLTWIEGRMLISTQPSLDQRAACGCFSARLGLALENFNHPAAKRVLIWDIAQFPLFLAVMSEATPPSIAADMGLFLQKYEREIAPQLSSLRRQVIHGDLNKKNVIFHPADDAIINGVIDFGDVVQTFFVCDLAVTAASNIVNATSFRGDIADVVAAYTQVKTLTRPELQLLGPLIGMRLIMGILIPEWHRRKNPESQHYASHPIDIEERMAMARALISTDLSD